MTSPCAKCKKPILWARTKRGANLPLDPEPHAKGNILLVREINKATATVLPKEAIAKTSEPLYISHFATCPFAAAFRKA